nr:hypothetical protein CPGR_01545 [Mycolicibacterium malmesburyense]
MDARRRPSVSALPFGARVAIVAVLGLTGYISVFAQAVVDAQMGSRTAITVVAPVLMVLITTGHRNPTGGVGDAESDWIIALLFGIACFTGIHLLGARMPTLSGLWQLQSLGFVVWFACISTVLFGARHVVGMWKLWVFATCCATPLPFVLVVAALSGSAGVAAVLTAVVGAVAVFLASEQAPLPHRLIATAGCFVVSASTVTILDAHTSPLAAAVVAAGVLPVLTVVLLHTVTPATEPRPHGGSARLPRCSPLSLVALAAVAIVLVVVIHPQARPSEPSLVAADWPSRADLGVPTYFPFITRFLGDDSSLTRYRISGGPGQPAAAVDVISSPNLASLDDLADAVWYPSTHPVEYRPAPPSAHFPSGARIVHSNADAATYSGDQHWYAVTWMWRTDTAYQRVTVIVSQALDGSDIPPPPRPISLLDTSIRPALWTTRQQPHVDGQVDPEVIRRADDVARRLVGSFKPAGAPTGD